MVGTASQDKDKDKEKEKEKEKDKDAAAAKDKKPSESKGDSKSSAPASSASSSTGGAATELGAAALREWKDRLRAEKLKRAMQIANAFRVMGQVSLRSVSVAVCSGLSQFWVIVCARGPVPIAFDPVL